MKTYTYHDLIHAYMQTQTVPVHPDFPRYYSELLATLERAFDVVLSEPRIFGKGVPARAQALWAVFSGAVISHNSILTPWESIMESGAMVHRVRQWEEHADEVFASVSAIAKLARQNQNEHLVLIERLFVMMYGELDETFTSEDLLALGFDDTREPQVQDYL